MDKIFYLKEGMSADDLHTFMFRLKKHQFEIGHMILKEAAKI